MVALIVFLKYKKRHQKRRNAPAYRDVYTLPDIVKVNSGALDVNSSSAFDCHEYEDIGDYSISPIFK